MTGVRVHLPTLVVLVIISACFSAAVYKIDHSSIADVRRAQIAAQQAGMKVARVCRSDIDAINEGHRSIQDGFQLQAQIAQDNIDAIDLGLRRGLIPESLRSYYGRARARQARNRDHFNQLAGAVTQLAPIC